MKASRRRAENETPTAATGEVTTSSKTRATDKVAKAGGAAFSKTETVDLVALTKDSTNPRYDTYMAGWASGWDAAAAFYQPRLVNLEAECDRLHLRAYNKPEDVKRILAARVNAGLRDYEWHFMRGDVQ